MGTELTKVEYLFSDRYFFGLLKRKIIERELKTKKAIITINFNSEVGYRGQSLHERVEIVPEFKYMLIATERMIERPAELLVQEWKENIGRTGLVELDRGRSVPINKVKSISVRYIPYEVLLRYHK